MDSNSSPQTLGPLSAPLSFAASLLASGKACPPPTPHTILWQPKEAEISKDRGGRYEHTNESSKPRTTSSSVVICLEKCVSASTPRHKQKVIENH